MSAALLDFTHDPDRCSWVSSAQGHPDFPIQNLPLGVFSPAGEAPRIGTAIGDMALDLNQIAHLLPEPVRPALSMPELNGLLGLPQKHRQGLRVALSRILADETFRTAVEPALRPLVSVTPQVPARIGDYTDFYVGIHHATNVGKLFRPDNPLLPNYKHVPIGYHGRASSIRASGVSVTRPTGQRKSPDGDYPVFGPSIRLDYELELGVWIAQGNDLGKPVPVARAGDHIAGICLLNDWSARDLQAWEYQPLGPFLAKNFHSTISPWVVTIEALAPFRIAQPPRPDGDPRPLPYLFDDEDQKGGALSITLSAWLTTARMRDSGSAPHKLSEGPASNMYWTIAQMVAHHASNGCNLNPGDLLGTGTISGPDPQSRGSLLEITEGGSRPLHLPTGETRSFLDDGDEVILRATAIAPGRISIGLGECRAAIVQTPDGGRC